MNEWGAFFHQMIFYNESGRKKCHYSWITGPQFSLDQLFTVAIHSVVLFTI